MSRLQYIPRFSLEIKINDMKIDIGSISGYQDSFYVTSSIQRHVTFLSLCTLKIDPTQFSD